MAASCVSRDIFGISGLDKEVDILQYMNGFSPVFMFEEGMDITCDRFREVVQEYKAQGGEQSDFWLRSCYLDITRSAMDFISRRKSDFFFTDSYFAEYSYLELEDEIL